MRDDAGISDRYRELRSKLEKFGPVNMTALEQYQDNEERHSYLSRQRGRPGTIHRRYDEGDPGNQSPQPGEVQESLRLRQHPLSRNLPPVVRRRKQRHEAHRRRGRAGRGGHRPLCPNLPARRCSTSLNSRVGNRPSPASLFWWLCSRYRPSRFCVLDEVDAALDDSNVERFVRPDPGHVPRHPVHPGEPQQADHRNGPIHSTGSPWKNPESPRYWPSASPKRSPWPNRRGTWRGLSCPPSWCGVLQNHVFVTVRASISNPVGAPLVGALFRPNHARRGDFPVAHWGGVFQAPHILSQDQATPLERSRPPLPGGRPQGSHLRFLRDSTPGKATFLSPLGRASFRHPVFFRRIVTLETGA